MDNSKKLTFALENYAKKTFNYLNKMVDKDNLPYFNIFWTEPAEAAHDWPDFGDVMSRQYQAAIMARRMTGIECKNEKIWYKKIKGYIKEDGLLYRPELPFALYENKGGEAALTLYALVTAYLDNPSDELENIIKKMVDGIANKFKKHGWGRGGLGGGFIIIDLMAVVRAMNYKPALKLAGLIVENVFYHDKMFTPDNNFTHGGHMHGNLRTLMGAANYALYVRDVVLYSRIDAIYRYVRDETSTQFGYIPEVIGRQGDIVLCETCALMDYLGLMAILANHGHPDYFDEMEKLVRNHLVESQLIDGSWLKSDNSKEDTEQFSWRNIGERMVGAYAGWSSPTQFLAAKETLHWGGPELRGKTRVFQNCCGGSGTHAYYIAWKNATRAENGTVSVNMHIDKSLPQVEVRGYQPYKGMTSIRVKQNCIIRVRVPRFTNADYMKVYVNNVFVPVNSWGNYLELGKRLKGDFIEIKYPLPIYETNESIGNPGYRTYRYKVTWKGDTVIRIEPICNDYKTGYSDFEKSDVEVFYGNEGPYRLYQREYMLEDDEPELSVLSEDTSPIDFWSGL